MRLSLLPLPFVFVIVVTVARSEVGQGWGLLPLITVAPAMAAAIGGILYTMATGLLTIAAGLYFTLSIPAGTPVHQATVVSLITAAGVTAAGVLACWARRRRDRELAEVRLVAESAQRVVLRPVPREVGPVQLAVRYQSAAAGARIGGDLYEVATAPEFVRLIVGDAEGKGLPGVQMAAAALGSFREAAYEESSLAGVVARMEASLSRQLHEEEYVTAILAEIRPDTGKMELLSCGHPPPLLLSPGTEPHLAGPDQSSLPLGLGSLSPGPGPVDRSPLVVPFGPGDCVLFYTDGVTEARNGAGEFFPLAACASVQEPRDPATLLSRLSNEVFRYVGHDPEDDIALLLAHHAAAA